MQFAPHPFTLRQLQYAVAVADALSFRKASECCNVSQPSLSTQVAQMEEVLGIRLFERDRRRVLVTAAGQDILDRARRILREADDLLELARCAGDPLAVTLRIGVIPTISAYLLPRIVPMLHAHYPRLTIRWIEGKTAPLVRDLHAGEIDAALLALEAEIGDAEQETIGRDPFVLATAASDPLSAAARPVRIPELSDANVLILEDGHCFGEQALAFCSNANVHVNEFRATSIPTLAQMVASGAGVTLLPELAAPIEAERANLRIRSFAKPEPGRTIGLVWRKRTPLAATLHQVAATVRQAYHASRSHPGSLRGSKSRQRTADTRHGSRRPCA